MSGTQVRHANTSFFVGLHMSKRPFIQSNHKTKINHHHKAHPSHSNDRRIILYCLQFPRSWPRGRQLFHMRLLNIVRTLKPDDDDYLLANVCLRPVGPKLMCISMHLRRLTLYNSNLCTIDRKVDILRPINRDSVNNVIYCPVCISRSINISQMWVSWRDWWNVSALFPGLYYTIAD